RPQQLGCPVRTHRSGVPGAGLAQHSNTSLKEPHVMTDVDVPPEVSGTPSTQPRSRVLIRVLASVAVTLLSPRSSYAQGSPWENAVNALMTSFTGPIARGLSLVSIVIGGVTFAFGETGSKRLLAGIVFGVGMAVGAVNSMAWLFP